MKAEKDEGEGKRRGCGGQGRRGTHPPCALLPPSGESGLEHPPRCFEEALCGVLTQPTLLGDGQGKGTPFQTNPEGP